MSLFEDECFPLVSLNYDQDEVLVNLKFLGSIETAHRDRSGTRYFKLVFTADSKIKDQCVAEDQLPTIFRAFKALACGNAIQGFAELLADPTLSRLRLEHD